ncbi:hypothetical protein A9Q81_12990 [Gammaproteobacteria bacterium 42_54_T18]|nr:hypothetical protein A9Q81_12990 [Gammaproteobacteria bacterium 42_54_T18]
MKWLTAHHENTTAPNDNEPDTDNPLPPSNNNGDSQSIQDKGYLSNAANPSAANPSASSGQKQPSIARNKTKIPISTLSIKHSQLFILAAINVLVYLSHIGTITEWLRRITGGNHIDRVNLIYLTSAKQYSSDLLGLLTESKMIISVLQSSQGGISFILDVQVQIGQILTSLYDAINFTWKLTLGSLSSIELLSLILDVSHFSMTIVITIFFVLLGFSIAFRTHNLRVSQSFRKLSVTLGLIVLATHFLIPYSIYGTATLSKYIFSNHKYEVYRGFSNLHTQLPRHDQDSDLKAQVKSTITHFKNNQSHVKKHSNNLSNLSAKHLTLTFVEYLLMPLIIFYLLMMLTKNMISFIFR